jgi:Mannose-6-phosphate isomerase
MYAVNHYMNPVHPWYPWQLYYPYQLRFHPHYAMGFPPVYSSWHRMELKDRGKEPFVININQAAKQNNTYRTALWTGEHFQVTVMSIPAGSDIGLEVHPNTDQFIRIEEGQGLVQMGKSRDKLDFETSAFEDDAIMIPAGTWHNVTNTGNKPLKVYVIYAPPQHPFGTVHLTKADAMASHEQRYR